MDPTTQSIVTLLGQGGAVAILGYFFVRMFTVEIPAMNARADAREKAQAEKDTRSEARLDAIQASYLASVNQLHLECERRMEAQQAAFAEMLTKQQEAEDRNLEQLTSALERLRSRTGLEGA